jgi:hypothetical protein
MGHFGQQKVEHVLDPDSHAPNTWLSTTLIGIESDAVLPTHKGDNTALATPLPIQHFEEAKPVRPT